MVLMKFIHLICLGSIPMIMAGPSFDKGNNLVDPMLAQLKDNMETIIKEANQDIVKKKVSLTSKRILIPKGSVPSENESKRYLRLAGASYCSTDALNQWKCGHCKQLSSTKFVSIIEEPKFETRALIAIDTNKKEIIISFRGSSNLKNWFQNINFSKTNLLKDNPDIEVHSGFKECRDALSPLYTKVLKETMNNNSGFKIVVTGHSLGGAIATLAILDIKDQLNVPFSNMRLVTFAQPRVGNEKFAEWFNKNILDSARFTNYNDPIPRLPLSSLGFAHHHTEVFIKDMKAKLCSNTAIEDKSCSYSNNLFAGFDDHSTIWGLQFGKGCD